jgi:3D (Asp-Asp-Asp) domain-containing protein
MKRLPRKIRRSFKKFPHSEVILLLALFNLIFPQHAAVAQSTPLPAPAQSALVRAENIPEYDPALGQLPEIADRWSVARTIRLSVTAYSSTVDQTDGDPFTAASGAKVFDGMIAYNALPFGTRVRFPDHFGDKVFVVLDRMAASKGPHIADIWMPTRDAAKQWGVRITTMEILD